MAGRTPAGRGAADGQIALLASGGGHLDLLLSAREVLTGVRRRWYLPTDQRSQRLVGEGEDVEELVNFRRDSRKLVRNVWDAVRRLAVDPPDVVVTSGAGLVIPYCLMARLVGCPIVYSETMARVTGPSASGRVLSRIAARTIVQWPEMCEVYPRAVLCRPALIEAVGTPDPDVRREGTFVAVGTHHQPFHRIFEAVEQAVSEGLLPGPVVGQVGHTGYTSATGRFVPWMSSAEMASAAAAAEFVVCHAGSGIIATSLRSGHRPLVVARREALGEHTDDHQQQIARKLSELGLVIAVEGPITAQDVTQARVPPQRDVAHAGVTYREALDEQLREALATSRRPRRWRRRIGQLTGRTAGSAVGG